MKFFKWLLMAAVVGGSRAQKNLFFPGSASYVPTNLQAQDQGAIPNRLSTPTKSTPTYIPSSTPGPNDERRVLEVPKPNQHHPSVSPQEVKPLDFIPPTQFSTPSPLNDFFGQRPQFFSNMNRPGYFGNSPFGLNDFNMQTFPQFSPGPDFSIFSSGDQPKSFHFRRQFNDKDGYTPWVDAGPKRPPVPASGDVQSPDGNQQIGLDPNFHQRYDLGPDGFFDFNKEKKTGASGFSGKTQAIMKIEPKTQIRINNSNNNKLSDGYRSLADEQNRYQQQHQQNPISNNGQQQQYNNYGGVANNLAQNYRNLRWPGQN